MKRLFDIKVKQIKTIAEFDNYLKENYTGIICAGRWGPMCIPVYGAMEQIEKDGLLKDVQFSVVDFDSEPARKIINLEECKNFRGLPFTVYYLKGKVVHTTASIQTRSQIEENIKKYLY